ncbi:cysteine peptidase family C39 domain-containing protein [Lacihabitans lacunae]|uniref:Cysteine peptidase family C39 domain-containing protein n=1 Tax=Lacihabitans lacunae TaxID=1028214 RepID=A0ABV7Z0N5_9BACT
MTLSINELNTLGVIKRLFSLKNVKVTSSSLMNKIVEEPTFPSLMSLSNILSEFNIFNAPLVINTKQLGKIPLPAIAHFENGNGYILINSVDVENNEIEWYHEQQGTTIESITEFSHKWQGVVLIAKPIEGLEEENYKSKLIAEKLSKLRTPFISASLAIILGYLVFNKNISSGQTITFYAILFLKIIGLILSAILVRLTIDSDNSIEEGSTKAKKLKNDIIISLNLDSRKIVGEPVWTEIGLIYFISSLATLLFLDSDQTLVFLKWLNLLTTLYIIWSLYYQIAILKNWCLICLGSLAFVLTEFATLFNVPLFDKNINPFLIGQNLILILLVVVFWVFIKKHLFHSVVNENLFHVHKKMKFNTEYVKAMYRDKQTLPPIFKEMKTVNIGNEEAEHNLLAVLNPNSILSKLRFLELFDLSTKNHNINIKIILVPDSPEDQRGKSIIRHILSMENEEKKLALINFFTYEKDIKGFFSNTEANNPEIYNALEANMNWVFLARIPLINPSIFFNKNLFPDTYKIHEIPKLIRIISSKNQV